MNTLPWFVYMIRTDDNQLYTGITTDMARRWREHTSGKAGARYFRGRTPSKICLLENYADRSQASKREAAIKQLKRAEKDLLLTQLNDSQRAIIDNFNNSLVTAS